FGRRSVERAEPPCCRRPKTSTAADLASSSPTSGSGTTSEIAGNCLIRSRHEDSFRSPKKEEDAPIRNVVKNLMARRTTAQSRRPTHAALAPTTHLIAKKLSSFHTAADQPYNLFCRKL